MGFSLGGDSSSEKTSSTGERYGWQQSQSYLDPMQQANQQQLAGGYWNALANQPNRFQNRFGALGNRATHLSGVDSSPGIGYLDQFAQQGNPYLQQQINQYGGDIARQYARQLPGLGGQYQQAGQRGGSRQGIAEGLMGEAALRQYGQGVTDMRSQAYGQQQQAAGQLANAQLGQRQFQLGALQQGLQANAMQQQGYFQPFQIGSQVMGAPSVLNSQYGYDYGYEQSQGKSSSGGFNIGF